MKVIGYTNVYYTLWEEQEPYKCYVSKTEYILKQNIVYLKNLSKDFDKAEAKVKEFKEDYRINLDLKGEKSFTRILERVQIPTEPYLFSFGMLKGQDIRTASDTWQLKRAFEQEKNIETKEFAKQRLLELGFIQVDNEFFTPDEYKKYQETQKEIELKKSLVSGWFYENGKKEKIKATILEQFHFPSQFGTVFVVTMYDEKKQLIKYTGSNPHNVIWYSEIGETVEFKATIKHDTYKDEKETKLLRISV